MNKWTITYFNYNKNKNETYEVLCETYDQAENHYLQNSTIKDTILSIKDNNGIERLCIG